MSANTNHVVNYRGVSVAYLAKLRGDIVARRCAPNMDVYVATTEIGSAGKGEFHVRKGQAVKVYKKEGKAWKASIPYANSPRDKLLGVISSEQVVLKPREEWTTEEVCEYVVKPEAKGMFRKGINVSTQGASNMGAFNLAIDQKFVSPTPFLGAFVSQARSCKFEALVNSLETHFKELKRDLNKQFVW